MALLFDSTVAEQEKTFGQYDIIEYDDIEKIVSLIVYPQSSLL